MGPGNGGGKSMAANWRLHEQRNNAFMILISENGCREIENCSQEGRRVPGEVWWHVLQHFTSLVFFCYKEFSHFLFGSAIHLLH